MAKAWIVDRWLKKKTMTMPDGTVIHAAPPAAVTRALANSKDSSKANVPDEYKTADFGRGKRWQIKWFETDAYGRRRVRSRSFTKKKDAELYQTAISDEQLSGKYINQDDARRTFAEASTEWRSSQHNLGDSTAKQYDDTLRAYVLPKWGATPLTKIDESAINEWVNQLKEGKAPFHFKEHAHKKPAIPRPAYLCQIVNSVFGGVIRYSLKRGWIQHDPMRDIHVSRKDPEREERNKVFLTHTEVEALAQAAKELPALGKYERDRKDIVSATAIRFMAYVGTRPGETWALRVGDINTETRRVTINKTLSKDGRKEGPTKGRKSRQVVIQHFLMEELEELMEGRSIDDYLFRPRRGDGGISEDNWRWRVFYKAVESAGLGDIEGLRPHSLRHTFASLSIKAGCDVVTLAAALGHVDVSITLNQYAGLWPDRLDEVSDALEKDRRQELG
ncbi:tyrosine-type recombinase/integrase [Bifidobacterium catulorum]|uniref:Tyr recombinase domain-containing protein n=1 Tax=Bifidobacterium catulorum TaxID=1630173 RepID=A0A2U2MS50_9BIFI|nr:site-specific integrase [Bifidobacterium catulorum]PWG59681.1 hypothetical protein DF200_06525 [Bifidobacterium catulorum]